MCMTQTTKLRQILKARSMTQKELSEKAGIECYQVSLICSNHNKDILLSTAKKICNALDCSLDEVFGDNDNDKL